MNETTKDRNTVGTLLLSYTQVATRYGLKVGTLYALVHQRRIPHVRLGRRFVRFREAEIEGWITQNVVAGGGAR